MLRLSLLSFRSITIATLVISISARADDHQASNIAVVDMTAVFAAHPLTESATKELTAAREASRDEFKEKSNTLKEILQRHQELIRAGKKTEAAEELKKANEAEKAIATLRTTGLRDMEENFRRIKVSILEDIQTAIREWNAEGTYAVILDSSSASSNGIPQVIHAPGATDVTEEIKALVKERKPKVEEEP